jgi:hypothetical protein
LTLLQADGVDAKIVSSLTSERLQETDGREIQVLLTDDLPDLATAKALCEEQRDLAPACSPVGPE